MHPSNFNWVDLNTHIYMKTLINAPTKLICFYLNNSLKFIKSYVLIYQNEIPSKCFTNNTNVYCKYIVIAFN